MEGAACFISCVSGSEEEDASGSGSVPELISAVDIAKLFEDRLRA